MEILAFIRETYWSMDYVVEVDGYKKVAKFVKEGLITSPFDVAIKKELGRNVHGLLVPERIEFHQVPVLIYDIEGYEPPEQSLSAAQALLNTLKNVLHVPRLSIPFIGLHDVVRCSGETFVFLPFVQNMDVLKKLWEKGDIIVAPEFFNIGPTDKSTMFVFGKLILKLTDAENVLEIAEKLCAEDPIHRAFDEDIPYFALSRPKIFKVKRIRRRIEDEIQSLILETRASTFLGVIGPQRSGKTTIIENLCNALRENGVPFISAVTAADLIVQTLELTADKISKRLLEELSFCLENTCKIDSISLAVVEALSTLDRVVIIVDDYHEVPETLRSMLRRIVTHATDGCVKVIAFSVEDFEDFSQKIMIPPFDLEETKELIRSSLGDFSNLEEFAGWVNTITSGLPGVMVEHLRTLYENNVFEVQRDGKYRFDMDLVAGLTTEHVIREKVQKFLNSPNVLLAVLGQKFEQRELEILKRLTNTDFRLEDLVAEGIVYREYNRYRFALKQYWEAFYDQIPREKREWLHEKLSENIKEPEKRAWHFEVMGRHVSAARVYLQAIYDGLKFYYSPSLLKGYLARVKELIGNRTSYAVIKFETELAERTEEFYTLGELEIPDTKLYGYYLGQKFFLLCQEKEAAEIFAKHLEGFGKLGTLRRTFGKVKAEYYSQRRRGNYYGVLKSILGQLSENNPAEAKLMVDVYLLLANLLGTGAEAVNYLKTAERIALDYNIAHKLPTIYNNLAVSTVSNTLAIQYLKRAVEVALDISLPARAYLARLNLLYHALYAGRIKEFVDGLMEIKPRLKMLNLKDELVYCNVLEAFYHAYNFEVDEALAHIDEVAELLPNDIEPVIQEIFVRFVTRDLGRVKELIRKVEDRFDELSRDERIVLELLRSYGTPDFGEKWLEYVASPVKIYREEILAVLGEELARMLPDVVRNELLNLEKMFIVDGSFLSLAILYEGFHNYYKATGNLYKSRVYLRKALEIYMNIGLSNACWKIAQLHDYQFEVRHTEVGGLSNYDQFVREMISSLKIADIRIKPDNVLGYFASSLVSKLPFEGVETKVSDDYLEREIVASVGNVKECNTEKIQASPLELVLKGDIDSQARYYLCCENEHLVLSRQHIDELFKYVEVLDFTLVSVFKSLLTTLRSMVDPLTKLYTRYYLTSLLEELFNNASQYNDYFTVVMCDIDNFKKINDTYGHLVGDEVLKTLAKVFRENLRSQDLVGRFGGEEFILVFPHTDVEETVIVLERLRRILKGLEQFPFTLTLSFGVAEYKPGITDSVDSLIIRADTALYHAKNTGKDRIVVYTEGMTGGLHA
ncbi:diguanylate cyclase [Fervidobacterium thailandense]|uniref:GGDEF domain-containing protein n=1 Tax=Fervidobacterium thailandense TaxID=1008305 RepID=A0A1E3G4Y4_9BACT|nr:diguanylate cyclase [Fervidobacterium thailandense]ODN30708.1 hypothetical protein A4H02_04020 [Fervidobacterium thailandense]